MATRCLCLGKGQVDILWNRQSASQLSSCNWPANQPCDKMSTCQTSGWSDIWWQGGQVDILCDRQSASQPACHLQLASQPDMWQDINLSGFGLVRYLVVGGQGAWPHWVPVQGLSTPTGCPWGVAYLTKARQVTQMSSTACYIPLALCLVAICSFVSMLPNHIFLHAM